MVGFSVDCILALRGFLHSECAFKVHVLNVLRNNTLAVLRGLPFKTLNELKLAKL